jgi:IclR helix-turn-helix domain
MAELLDRIHAEIRERLAASRGAAQEYERLEAALAALGGPGDAAGAPAPRRARKPARPRAPRGANREAVLRALEERPGASASELAAASGVNRTVLYGLLNRLIERGEVAKEELPGGTTGYKLLREEPTAFPARPPAPEPPAGEPPAPEAEAATETPAPEEAGEAEPRLAAAA